MPAAQVQVDEDGLRPDQGLRGDAGAAQGLGGDVLHPRRNHRRGADRRTCLRCRAVRRDRGHGMATCSCSPRRWHGAPSGRGGLTWAAGRVGPSMPTVSPPAATASSALGRRDTTLRHTSSSTNPAQTARTCIYGHLEARSDARARWRPSRSMTTLRGAKPNSADLVTRCLASPPWPCKRYRVRPRARGRFALATGPWPADA